MSHIPSDVIDAYHFLQGGGGITGALIRDYAWESTELGPITTWPQSLETAVCLIVHSTVPIVLLWGDSGVMIYNDAYSHFSGGRHPGLMGTKVREAWPEVADFNDNVMRVGLSGGTLAYKDQELTLFRHGVAEQVWMNLDYSPVLDEAASGTDLNKFENRYRHKDGSLRWISWHTSVEGGLIYAYGCDITNEKLAADELEQSGARLRAIFETNHQFQGLLNLDGTLLNANATSLMAIGCNRTDVLGKYFWETSWFTGTPDIQKLVRHAVAMAASGEIVRQEIHLNLAVGGWRWFDFALRPIFDNNGSVVAIVPEAIELTEHRNAEEALRESQKMGGGGQLTGGIAHDFNNLLAGISGSLELLEARVTQGRVDGMERYIGTAQASATRAAALTQRLLAFSRRQTLDPKTTDINRLVSDMADLIRRTMGPAIEVEVVGAGGLWLTKVDSSQLENALLNLCVNARDAMPDSGRLTIETANKWLDERAAREHDLLPGQYVCLSATDTGTGMGNEVIQHAFEPFFTTKPLGRGTGLGLSMIYGFVRQSGGQVRIYSEIDKGTTLSLYLPRFVGTPDIEPAEPFPEESADGYGETVLVIDDEPTIRELIVEVLESAVYVALSAADGASGLKVIECDVRIDLLITDVGLPGRMNGRQVADAAREIRPALKVLFITGYAENAAIGNGHLDHGMQLLTKPFALATLATKVREILET